MLDDQLFERKVIKEFIDSKQYLRVISDFTQSLLYVNTEEEIITTIVTKAVSKLDLEDCVVYLIDKEKGICSQRAAFGPKSSYNHTVEDSIDIPIGKGIVGTVAATGEAEIIPDTTKDERYIMDDIPRLSEIAVPISINNEVIGIIDSENSQKDFYTEEHLSILTTIAAISATKLSQAKALADFQKANIELEMVIKESTEELERSNEALKRYAYTVSHDLKSPVRIINGHVSILKKKMEGILNEEQLGLLDTISKNAEGMHSLIDGVLKHSLKQKHFNAVETVDLNLLINELIERYSGYKHIKFELPNCLPEINAKKVMMQQVFQNLINNAIFYNDKDKGIIEIKSEEIGDYYLFSVKDNGIGIAPKDCDKIFNLFSKAENNNRKDATGIGLATVKKIIASYKGKIWVSAELGKGATFFFTLPK